MTEQSGPRELVRYASAAEDAGFDFEVMSDHYSPWLTEQGHAPYAWATLGAVAHATSHVGLMTYVTCPTMRYHPALVAQKSATVQILAEGRFTLGLGSGENLNEHVVGRGWPAMQDRHDMLRGGRGDHPRPPQAVTASTTVASTSRSTRHGSGTSPTKGVEIGVAVAGERSHRGARSAGGPPHRGRARVPRWCGLERRRGPPRIGDQARAVGQVPICWDPDEEAAVKRAHEQFRWFAGGWSVNADLPTPAGFAAATGVRAPPMTSPTPSPAARTSTRPPRRSWGSRRPASPTWRSCRSATRARTVSSPRRRLRSCSGYGRPEPPPCRPDARSPRRSLAVVTPRRMGPDPRAPRAAAASSLPRTRAVDLRPARRWRAGARDRARA